MQHRFERVLDELVQLNAGVDHAPTPGGDQADDSVLTFRDGEARIAVLVGRTAYHPATPSFAAAERFRDAFNGGHERPPGGAAARSDHSY